MADYIDSLQLNNETKYISLSLYLYSYDFNLQTNSSVINITTPFSSVSITGTTQAAIKDYFTNLYTATTTSAKIATSTTNSSTVTVPCSGILFPSTTSANIVTALPLNIRCTSTSTYIDYQPLVSTVSATASEPTGTIAGNKTVSSITLSAYLAGSGASIQYVENKIPSYYE